MPKYLVTIYHRDDYDPAISEDAAMHRDIDVVNEEMVAAGARIFVGGLYPAESAKSLRARPDGSIAISDGSYLKTNEHIGGLWVVEAEKYGRRPRVGKESDQSLSRAGRSPSISLKQSEQEFSLKHHQHIKF